MIVKFHARGKGGGSGPVPPDELEKLKTYDS